MKIKIIKKKLNLSKKVHTIERASKHRRDRDDLSQSQRNYEAIKLREKRAPSSAVSELLTKNPRITDLNQIAW